MNYREQQLRQMMKRDFVPLNHYQTLAQDNQQLQQEKQTIFNDY